MPDPPSLSPSPSSYWLVLSSFSVTSFFYGLWYFFQAGALCLARNCIRQLLLDGSDTCSHSQTLPFSQSIRFQELQKYSSDGTPCQQVPIMSGSLEGRSILSPYFFCTTEKALQRQVSVCSVIHAHLLQIISVTSYKNIRGLRGEHGTFFSDTHFLVSQRA